MSELDGASIQKEFMRLDKLLEHRTRLAICALLQRYDRINFRRFKELLNETDGNLGAQLRKLEDADYIKVEKRFEERRPVSWYKICPCLLYTSPSPRDRTRSRMPSSA